MGPVIIFAAIAFWGSALGGTFYFVRRYIRAVERRAGNETDLAELRERVTELEDALDVTRREVERLDTAQEFTTRMLASRAGQGERTS